MDPFEMNHDEIPGAVKHDVGLVQGKRIKPLLCPEATSSDDEMENSYHANADGTGDDVTKVLKMECCVFKQEPLSVTGPEEEEDTAQVEMDLERMFVAYCFQYDIPYVPNIRSTTKKAGGFHQQHRGEQSHGTPSKSKTEKSNFTASTPATFIPLPSGIGKIPTSSGGGGGGKRPPRAQDVKKIPSDVHSQSDTTSESSAKSNQNSRSTRKNKLVAESISDVSSTSTLSASTVGTETNVIKRETFPRSNVNFNPNPQVRLIEDEPLKLQEGSAQSSQRGHTSKSGGKKKHHHKDQIQRKQRKTPSLISTIADISQSLERDHEWLDYTTSEDETRDQDAEETEGNRPPEERERPVDPDLQRFVNATKNLYRLTSLLGLEPYQRVVRGNKCIQVKWDPRHGEFMGMCLHAILFFLVTASAFVSMGYVAFGIVEPASSSQQVLQVEFANHVSECLIVAFLSFFLCVWAVSSVMELGIHYAEFMTRVNFGICLTKYDVTEGVQSMIIKSLSFTGSMIVVALLLFFGGRTKTSVFREACGFIGFAVIRPLNFDIRESIYYPLVEILGLVIALHSLLCFNVVILQFLVYAKALENMARRFNLRLVYRLGQIYEGAPTERKKRIKKYIPFSKLYAEHRIVASLFHQFGQVNSVILSCFLLVVALEVMLLAWVIFQVFAGGSGKADPSNMLHAIGTVTLAVPLRLKKAQTELAIQAVLLFDLTVIGFLKFGAVLHTASDTLHIGMQYIRRHGLMLCRNSKERRFILSMISSYAPKAPYWIGKSFHFNRSSVLGARKRWNYYYLTFLVGASMVFASFNPSRTTSQHLQQCDENGDCVVYKFQKVNLDRVYAVAPPPAPGRPPPPSSVAPVSSSTTEPKELENQLSSFVYLKTLSTGSGSYPYDLYEQSASCPSKWSVPTVIFTPYLYRQLEFTGSTGKHKYFAQVRSQYAEYSHSSQECADLRDKPREQITFPAGKTSACVSDTFACHYFPFQSAFDDSPIGSEVVDGFSRPVSKKDMDDCRNLNITTTGHMGKRMEARVRIVYSGLVPGASDPLTLLCCYEYGGYNTSLEQARVCNMPDTDTLNMICLFGTTRGRMKGEVLKLHDEILRRIQDEAKNDNLEEFLLLNEEIITGCLCRLDGSDPTKEDFLQCRAMQPIPCVPGSYPDESLFTLQCGPNTAPEVDIHIPVLLLAKPNPKLFLPVEHQRYASFCPGAAFKDANFHNDDLFYKDPFEAGGPPVPITDCSGNPIVGGLTDSDDCRNWRIPTPNLDGEMKLPTVILKQNDYNSRSREFTVGVPADDSIFVCCFHYASDIFQRNPTQLTFCNAPSIRAMNHPEWCLALAQNGIRNSPTFPLGKRVYEQLSGKLKLVAKYYKAQNNGENLLRNPVEQQKWQKCMCSDLIRDLEQAEIGNAVDICYKSIPIPCELHAVGAYDAYPKCPVGWPQIKEMVYPKIFTIENGIWNEIARFVIPGAPRANCPSQNDANWENDPNLDNANIKFSDCGLNVINSLTKDDCGIYNIPILNGKGVVTKPTLVVNLEYTLMSYNVPNPRWAAAHCCYHYSGYDDQWKVCNLPNSDSFLKKCDMSNRAPQRLAHEREFSRMAMVEEINFGAVFKGSLVPRYDATTEESPVRKLFDDCICQNTNHAMCEAYYLPPCIAPKVALSATIQVDDTYTRCDHAWNTGLPDFLRIPVVREFDKSTMQFKKLSRFRDGSTPADCPNGKTTDILTNIPSGMTISDCYGVELGPTSLPVDDCGNPFIRTPKRMSPSEWEYPTMHLIPLDRMPGMTGDEMFCCFLYPISNVSEVNVCNMPDAGAVRNKCKERNQTSKTIIDAIGQFKRLLRGTGGDDILSRGLSDQGRAMWTDCICGRNESICNALSPPCFADPAPLPAPLTQEWVDKMYYTCRVPTTWYIYRVMYLPKYFRRDPTTTAFTPLKVEGLPHQDCSEFPRNAEVSTGQESEVYDCEGKMYGDRSPRKYNLDDCQNVQIPMNVPIFTKISVKFNITTGLFYPMCCNNYPRDPAATTGRSDLTWRQAERCNTVSNTAYSIACRSRIEDLGKSSPEVNDLFVDVWRKLNTVAKAKIEEDYDVVACVCRHLEPWGSRAPSIDRCKLEIKLRDPAG